MKIYTKTGDDGTTSLFSGGRVTKDHLRVEAYGTVDELNSTIGVVRANNPTRASLNNLERVQNHLFRLGADLATPLNAKSEWLVRVDETLVTWLEDSIDRVTQHLPPLQNFILPGGSPAGAHLHVARTVCRRAERRVVSLAQAEEINEWSLKYLNRLSDWLFVLARYENLRAGITEEKWHVGQASAESSDEA